MCSKSRSAPCIPSSLNLCRCTNSHSTTLFTLLTERPQLIELLQLAYPYSMYTAYSAQSVHSTHSAPAVHSSAPAHSNAPTSIAQFSSSREPICPDSFCLNKDMGIVIADYHPPLPGLRVQDPKSALGAFTWWLFQVHSVLDPG